MGNSFNAAERAWHCSVRRQGMVSVAPPLLHLWHRSASLVSTPGPSSSHISAGVRYRFHSSFFMPRGATLGYLQSTFTGQLPQAFATGCISCATTSASLCVDLCNFSFSAPASKGWWHSITTATRAKQPNFNAVNKEESRHAPFTLVFALAPSSFSC